MGRSEKFNLLREFSVPLLCGVAVALAWANFDRESYLLMLHGFTVFGHDLHFFTNDIFMAFFFGMAAVEITQSCLPGGDLNPPRKALNPLLATVGGVVGPILVYIVLNRLFGSPALANGWGIPTATDIALAWLVARMIFGRNHPAIAYLLLLAIADDAIGLGIIAIFYPDPAQPIAPLWLLLCAAAMAMAYTLRRARITSYWPYLALGGLPAWIGLHRAHLHPALALALIVPFFPHPGREERHLFDMDPSDLSPLARFEHEWKVIVDFGLFFFGIANAGVSVAEVGTATWFVAGSLFAGKTVGITLFGLIGLALGLPLPTGLRKQALLVLAMIAGVGFTVALFVAGEAFTDPVVQGQAKMGAMGSIAIAAFAWATAKMVGVRRIP